MIDPYIRIHKMCDKCELVYPEHYVICIKCGTENLRAFKIHNNEHELARNWQ